MTALLGMYAEQPGSMCRNVVRIVFTGRMRERVHEAVTTRTTLGYKTVMPGQDSVGAPPTLGDEALVHAARLGDVRALRAIFDRHAPMARRIVGRALGPRWDVEDIVQDVFLALFKNLGTVREPAALRAFVISICVRSVRQELRKRKLRKLVGLQPPEELEQARVTSDDPEARQTLTRLYRALERLPFRERAAFTLRHVEGMELDDVASALGVSTPTVRRSLVKARERLSRLLRKDDVLSLYFPVRE